MSRSDIDSSGPTRRAPMRRRLSGRVVRAMGAGLLVPAVLACGDPIGTAPPVTQLVVTPAVADLGSLGETVELSALALGPGGPASTSQITWSSSEPTVASVSGQGTTATVTARGTGVAEITADAGTASGLATITVTLSATRVVVAPAALSLEIGGGTVLLASLVDAGGSPISGAAFVWASSAPQYVTVDGNGAITAVGIGTATITATSGSVSGTSTVTVVPPSVDSVAVSPDSTELDVAGQVQLTAATFDADGTPLAGRAITWAATDPSIVTVDASGLVTAVAPGATTVTATSEGVQGAAVIIVRRPPPPAVLTDDFETGSLAAWTQGGRRLGTYTTDVVDRNGSLKGHVFQSTFTEVTLFTDLEYASTFRLGFEMEAQVTSTQGGSSTFYATGGARVYFMDVAGGVLGWVSYQLATSTAVFAGCTHTACSLNRITDPGPTVHDYTAADLLAQITIDESAIDFVRVEFWGYGSGWIGGLTANVWFDDFRYEAAGW